MPAQIKPTPYTGFTGLDLRRHPDASDDKSARIANNVFLTIGGEYKTRGQLRLVAVLDPNSVGLYKIADELHAAFPQSPVLPLPIPPPGVLYDPIGLSRAVGYPANTLLRVTAYDSWGLSSSGHIRGYIVVKRNKTAGVVDGNVSYEHHYLDDLQGSPFSGTFVNGTNTVNGTGYTVAQTGTTLQVPGDTRTYLITNATTTVLTLDANYVGTSGTKAFLTIAQAATLVDTGFPPGPALLSFGNKFWATCPSQGTVHFSSTVNGPTDWVTLSDAGNLQVLRFIAGDRVVTGLGFYEGQLAVFFKDAVELWSVGADPDLHKLEKALNGPGTDVYPSIGNVLGDLIYFSQGGFRSLRQDSLTGRMVENGIGAKIKAITQPVIPANFNPCSLWRQATGQYLCAFGNTVYVMGYYPESQLMGWTTWTLPVTVDYMVEVNGVLYIRATNNNLYIVDDEFSHESGFTFEVQTQFLNQGVPGYRKQFTLMDVVQSGKALVQAYYNSANPAKIYTGTVVSGSTVTQKRTPLCVSGVPSIAIRFTGSEPWTLSGYIIHSRTLNRS